MENITNHISSNLQDLEFYQENETKILFKLNKYNHLYIDNTEDTDDGTWETPEDWNNFISNLEDDNTLLSFYFGEKSNISKFDNFNLIKLDESSSDKAPEFQSLKLIFDEPQEFIFGHIGFGDNIEYITKEISELFCNFTYEPYFRSSYKEGNVCSGVDIYLTDIIFIK